MAGITELPLNATPSILDRYRNLFGTQEGVKSVAGSNFTTSSFGSILGDVSSFVKGTFVPVYQALNPVTPILQTAAPVPTGVQTASPITLQSMLLIGGIAIFGVALVLIANKKKGS